MFRKLRDGLASAASAISGTSEQQNLQRLQNMGFSATDARNALRATDGDVERAAELLLASGASSSTSLPSAVIHTMASTTATTNNNRAPDNAAAMERALQESLQTEEDRRMRLAEAASLHETNNTVRSAAAVRAGQAAEARAKGDLRLPSTNSLSNHHPNVQVPAKLQDKSKEEQLLRCAERLKAYPSAVDTLHRALSALQKDPNNDKFRKIDKTSAGYKRTLQGAPGAEDLLRAMNFTPRGTTALVIERPFVDPALLYLGISALEQMKRSDEYQKAKRKIQFAKEVKEIQMSGDSSEKESIARAGYISKCPAEPHGNRGALVQVVIADETVRRRFDGDDVLQDVLNWLGGIGSAIPDKILSRDWCMVDLNRYPLTPIDCEADLNKTLQVVGFWPSGRLEILPSDEAWKSKRVRDALGETRGLGAAR